MRRSAGGSRIHDTYKDEVRVPPGPLNWKYSDGVSGKGGTLQNLEPTPGAACLETRSSRALLKSL